MTTTGNNPEPQQDPAATPGPSLHQPYAAHEQAPADVRVQGAPAAGTGPAARGTGPGPQPTASYPASGSIQQPPTAWAPPPAGWAGPTTGWSSTPGATGGAPTHPVPPAFMTQPKPANRWSVRRRVVAGIAAAATLAATVGISATLGFAAARASLGAEGSASAPAVPGSGSGQTAPDQNGGVSNPYSNPYTNPYGNSDQNGSSGQGGSSQGGSSGGSSGNGSSGQSGTVDSEPATASESRGVALIDTVLPGGEAAGTGVVLTADGQVLTNYHVVEGSTQIRVTIAATGQTYTAKLVGAEPSGDVALLQLEGASGLTTATLDQDEVTLGQPVTAVGNAGGTGRLTAADGQITDLSAPVTTAAEGAARGEHLTGLLETSSDVVPGDSGGPLIDAQGEVVGINTAASSGPEIDGYAIPIDTALAVVQQIRAGQETPQVRIGPAAFLGIELSTAPRSSRESAGALVAGVTEGGAAAKAGLAEGDTITRIGSDRIASSSQLSTVLGGHQPGDRIQLTWTTAEGTSHTGTITLGSSPIN